MDPRMIPKGSGPEYNYGELEGKAQPNLPGVYFHPQAEKFIETTGIRRPDGSISYAQDPGKIQADAFTQMGYRPATAEEARFYQEAQKAAALARKKKESRTTVVFSGAKA